VRTAGDAPSSISPMRATEGGSMNDLVTDVWFRSALKLERIAERLRLDDV